MVGLLYTPLWPADILHFYGVYLAAAAFLVAAASRRLVVLASALVLSFPILLLVIDYERGWDWSTLAYESFWTPAGFFRHLFFNGFHPVVPWLAFLLLGMVLGRLDMGVPSVRKRVFARGVAVVVVAESSSALLIRTLSSGLDSADGEVVAAVFGTSPMPPVPLYMLAGAGTACALIAACVALGQRFQGASWLRPLVATGQLALTLYVAHVVVGMGTLETIGRLEVQTLSFSLLSSGIFCIAGVVFASVWRRRFKRGPLEALMRRLTGEATVTEIGETR